MLDFSKFKTAVAKQFAEIVKTGLYRSSVPKDVLWDTYLASFPPGTNPIYQEKTEHDCNCCKQFIRSVGNAVTIKDGKIVSIWDVVVNDMAYQEVANALAAVVQQYPIETVFLSKERTAGKDKNFLDTVHGVRTFEHFFVNIPASYVQSDIGKKTGEAKTQHAALLRAMSELTLEAVDATLELIDQNSLYRGAEHKFAVQAFRNLKLEFAAIKGRPEVWAWTKLATTPGSVLNFRNSSIGTLVTDLSNDVDLEEAVRKFEAIMAPANYKRPTSLVTKAMIEKAKVQLTGLGLVSALERRYAHLDDITVNNILFADRSAKAAITGDVFSTLSAKVAEKPKAFDRVEEVSIDKFLADILPKAQTLSVMMTNEHRSNLVSLIAPVDPTASNLFKWGNQFSWDYVGGVADSIKARVKAAGGNVTGELCCRLAWNNRDDLDLSMVEPMNYTIYYGNRNVRSPLGGQLDVDANGGSGMMDHPVENIYYQQTPKIGKGQMFLMVKQFSKRDTNDIGFDVEIDVKGEVYSFSYDKPMRSGEQIVIATITDEGGNLVVKSDLPMSRASKPVWGVATNIFQRVNVMMLSPNHWDGQGVGNKHYFFMLDRCQNEGKARGFFNEFLREDLSEHRKTLEMVGSTLLANTAEGQLSGLGFSSTQRNSLLCCVGGATTRVVKVVF